MRNFSSTICVLAMLAGTALAGEKVYLWPEGKMPDAQPQQIAAMTNVAGAKDFNPDDWRLPYIEWLDPPKNDTWTDTCVILISGGAYQNQCDVDLVKGWARDLTALGVTCVNLVHRTPRRRRCSSYTATPTGGRR